ncbi:MAG: hypothetical protein FJW88_11730 [Actinobacteria bacterium]|nr:hypothetical protein [Actinomycetota bacterium]
MSGTAVRELGEQLAELVRDFDPSVCDRELAKSYVEAFAHVERLGVAGRTLAVTRVEATRACTSGRSPARTATEWPAQATGSALGDAIRDTTTARLLDQCAATETSLRGGQLSAAQAAA